MKAIVVGIGVASFLVLAPSPGSAGPETHPTIKVLSLQLPATYTGGALDLTFRLESDRPVRLTSAPPPELDQPSLVTVTLESSTGAISQLVTLPGVPASAPTATKSVKLTDSAGFPSGCNHGPGTESRDGSMPKAYKLTVTAPSGAVLAEQAVEVTATCTASSKIEDDWTNLTHDRLDTIRKDAVYLTNPVLELPPTCLKGPKVKVDVVNHSKLSSASLVVQVKAGNDVTSQTPAAFPLAAGASKEVVAAPVAELALHDPTGAGQLVVITDWLHSVHVADHFLMVKTTRSCTLTHAFVDARTAR